MRGFRHSVETLVLFKTRYSAGMTLYREGSISNPNPSVNVIPGEGVSHQLVQSLTSPGIPYSIIRIALLGQTDLTMKGIPALG